MRRCRRLLRAERTASPGGVPERVAGGAPHLALPLYPQMTDEDQTRRRTELLARVLRRSDPMCGIAGVLDRRAPGQPPSCSQRMSDVRSPTAAPTARVSTSTAPSASATAGSRSSTSRPPARSRWRTRTARYVITYNGEIYNFRELRPSSSALGTASARAPTPRSCSTRTRSGAPAASSASTACSPSRSGTRERARALPGPRPLRHQAALLRRGRRRRSSSPRRSRRCSRIRAFASTLSLPHLLEYFTFQNIFTDRTLFDGVRLLPPGPSPDDPRRTAARRGRSSTGTSTSARSRTAQRPTRSTRRSSTGSSARRSTGSSSATSPSAPT